MDSGDTKSSEPRKPKFRPKAQVRKKSPTLPPSVPDFQEAAARYRAGNLGGGNVDETKGGYGDARARARGRERRGHEGEREFSRWDDRSGGRGGRGRGRGRDGRGRDGGYGGRGRGGFVPMGQDFFVAGGGTGSAAYMPSGVAFGKGTGGAGESVEDLHGGGDTSDSEEEAQRKSRARTIAKAKGAGEGKLAKAKGKGKGFEDDDLDDDLFGVGDGNEDDEEEEEGGEGGGAHDSIGPKPSRVAGMKVTGNVMSKDDPMRPVALPVTATAQDPSAPLFASSHNQEEMEDEEDSSFFFIQLPTKLPRPLSQFQRGHPAYAFGRKAKTEGEDEAGDGSSAAAAGSAGTDQSNKPKAVESTHVPVEGEVALDKGLRRMRPGKIGKLYLHESGKIRMVIGGVSLLVHPGLPVSFMEEGVTIDAPKKTFCSFGQATLPGKWSQELLDSLSKFPVTKRLVCTPDFEQLYRRAQENQGDGGVSATGASGPGRGSGLEKPTAMDVE